MVGGTISGTVDAFDVAVGLGQILTVDGHRVPFHCTQIGDGSRRIDVGTPVQFELAARMGRYEAVAVRPRHEAALQPRSATM